MKRIAFFALVVSLLVVGQNGASGDQQQIYSSTGPDSALALAPPNQPIGPPMTPIPARSVASARYHGGFSRECPGFTKSRRARLHTNRTLERLLARGVDDPLSQPAYHAAMRAEGMVIPEVDACNAAWLRDVSIYRGTVIVLIGDRPTQTLASLLLTILGFEVSHPAGPDAIIQDIDSAIAANKEVAAVVLDTRIAGPELRDKVLERLRSFAPEAVLIDSHPRPGDRLVAQYRRHGFANLLPEPYNPPMLWRALNRITGASRQRAM